MNFVNLDKVAIEQNSERDIIVTPVKVVIQQEPERDIVITPVKVELPDPEEKEGCIKAECPITVGCSQEYFTIKNLFSELTDDYQRAIIRQNLGITGADALLWGKIEGNLANQKDLCNFIIGTVNDNQSGILDKVNLELKYWTQHIENKIESFASNIKNIDIIPRYATSHQIPVDVLVTWEYANPIEGQAINGLTLDPDVRSYIFESIDNSFSVRLSYLYNGVWLSRNVNFDVTFPIFYGTSSNWEENQYTIQNTVKVNAGEEQYIYVFTKNPSDLAVNGIIGGFEQDSIIYIQAARYYVYRSLYPNLGETIIKVYDRE